MHCRKRSVDNVRAEPAPSYPDALGSPGGNETDGRFRVRHKSCRPVPISFRGASWATSDPARIRRAAALSLTPERQGAKAPGGGALDPRQLGGVAIEALGAAGKDYADVPCSCGFLRRPRARSALCDTESRATPGPFRHRSRRRADLSQAEPSERQPERLKREPIGPQRLLALAVLANRQCLVCGRWIRPDLAARYPPREPPTRAAC